AQTITVAFGPGAATSIQIAVNQDGSVPGSIWSYTAVVTPTVSGGSLPVTIAIGGDFTLFNGVTRQRVALLNSDGTGNGPFNSISGFNAGINGLALYSAPAPLAGKILAVGDFSFFSGASRNGVARLNADGTLDVSFNPGTGATNSISVQAAVVQNDGKAIIAGSFILFNGQARIRIARLNTDGSLDSVYQSGLGGFDNTVIAVALQSDQKLIAGGRIGRVNGNTNYANLARLNVHRTLDGSFNNSG